jgi:hypothetical protein
MSKKTNNESTINFMYFIYNFPYKFYEKVWEDEPWLAKHLQEKWYYYQEKASNTADGFIKWFMELDMKNRNKLLDWVEKNYNAF